MSGLTLLTSAALLLSLATQSHCAVIARVDNVSPVSNTTVAELAGPTSIQFNCDIYETNATGIENRVTTAWFFRRPSDTALTIISEMTHPEYNISGTARDSGPFPTFRNLLTIVNMTSSMDEVWLFCGHSAQGVNELAMWRLRVYYPPLLSDGLVIKVVEGDGNIPVDLATPPLAYPTPTNYQWSKDGSPVATTSRITFSYPSVLFSSLQRSDSGAYGLTATNHRTDNGAVIGSDEGGFTLDVLYGPDIVLSTRTFSVVAGDPVTLVCGTSLDSNPMATISWLDISGAPIPNAGRYTFNNDSAEVSLDFAFTRAGDSGVWACVVVVSDPDVLVASGGQLVSRDNKEIGRVTNQITLIVVVPPSEPQLVEVLVQDPQPTSATLSWRDPSVTGQPGITAYQITAEDGTNPPIVFTSANNNTEQTITGLLPGTEYRFTVRAIAASGDAVALSNASLPRYANTSLTLPAPRCESALSDNGRLTVTWSLLHTGGIPLTSLSVSYTYTEGLNVVQGGQNDVELADAITSSRFDGLVTGLRYTFTVTAVNALGPTQAACTPVEHLIGVPMEPRQPIVTASAADAVTVTMETTSPGVQEGEQYFYDLQYRIVQDDDIIESIVVAVSRGGAVTQLVSGLMQGNVYVFSVRARNEFGESRYVTSEAINFNGTVSAPTLPLGAIVGGALGGLVGVVILIVLIAVVVTVCILRAREGGSYRVSNKKARNRIDSSAGVKVEEVQLDVGVELEGPKELHYADLDTFRPPSATPTTQQKPASPTTHVEKRVEYATIDTFKKPPSGDSNGHSPTTV